MRLSCRTEFNRSDVESAARKGGLKGLYRAAALLMRKARQKIRFRKNKASTPGNPPFQHSKGPNSFRHSIRFAVDRENLAAYVGPQKVYGKKGKNVPRTLEFGGITSPAPNPAWFQTRNVPAGLDSEESVASWLLQKGSGPLFMARSEAAVINQAGGNVSIAKHIQQRKIRMNGKRTRTVYYAYLPIRTPKQAKKAARNIVQNFGLPNIRPHRIAPRPFMGPTLQESRNSLAQHFQNTVTS